MLLITIPNCKFLAKLVFVLDISFKSDLITSLTNRTGGFLSTEAERFNDRKSPLEHTSYPNEGQRLNNHYQFYVNALREEEFI